MVLGIFKVKDFYSLFYDDFLRSNNKEKTQNLTKLFYLHSNESLDKSLINYQEIKIKFLSIIEFYIASLENALFKDIFDKKYYEKVEYQV